MMTILQINLLVIPGNCLSVALLHWNGHILDKPAICVNIILCFDKQLPVAVNELR